MTPLEARIVYLKRHDFENLEPTVKNMLWVMGQPGPAAALQKEILAERETQRKQLQ